jgi:hypothetical protein
MSNDAFNKEKAAWDWLQANMYAECEKALRKFVSINPHYNGAEWWDVLSVLCDSDSHLDITEPMCEEMEEWDTLREFVTLTCIYASKPFATEYTTAMRVTAVQATIDNNSR